MDLVAEMLARELPAMGEAGVSVGLLRPPFVRRFSRMGGVARNGNFLNADRILNRFVDYPRFLRVRGNEFDLFHIIDHSYSHLAFAAGPQRSVVTCHDLDAFRCIIEPDAEARSLPYTAMAKRIMRGFSAAAAIACDSAATRDAVVRHQIAPAQRLTVNPNGVAAAFNPRPDPCAEGEAARLLGPPERGRLEILHVGSTIARKRIDVLLRMFAAIRRELPAARLLRVGGAFTPAQRELINQLALPSESIAQLPFLSREALAAVYRRAALLVLPSDSEGFGLPILEALACGTPVVLSDIAVFREVGGPAAAFCAVADIERWTDAIVGLVRERCAKPRSWSERVAAGMKWAGQFTWRRYAERAAQLYRTVIAG